MVLVQKMIRPSLIHFPFGEAQYIYHTTKTLTNTTEHFSVKHFEIEISQQYNEYSTSSIYVTIQGSAQVQDKNPQICKTIPDYKKYPH